MSEHKTTAHAHTKGATGDKEEGRGPSVAITFSLPGHVDDHAAELLRRDLQHAVQRFLVHRLGAKPVDLICH